MDVTSQVLARAQKGCLDLGGKSLSMKLSDLLEQLRATGHRQIPLCFSAATFFAGEGH